MFYCCQECNDKRVYVLAECCTFSQSFITLRTYAAGLSHWFCLPVCLSVCLASICPGLSCDLLG